jgi:hypothetical protein
VQTYTTISGGVTPGAGRKVRLEVVDDTSGNPVLSGYWNGAKLFTVTDTDAARIRTGTRGGLGGYAWYDQIHVDNFTVAALSASTGSGGTGGTTAPSVTAILDPFDGSASGATLGTAWNVPVGSWTRANGVAIPNTGNVGKDVAIYNAFAAPDGSQFAQVDWLVGDPSVDRSMGVMVRCPLVGDGVSAFSGYMLEANQAGNRVDLLRIINGTGAGTTGLVNVPGGVSPGVGQTLRLEVRDDTNGNPVLKGYWDGALQFTFTDSSSSKLTAGRYGGMHAYNSGGVLQADNFRFGQLT